MLLELSFEAMPRTPTRILSTTLLLGILVALSACLSSSRTSSWSFRRGAVSYRVGALPPAWSRSAAHGADLAFHRRDGGTIAVSSHCSASEDVPLDVLTNHLLFGVGAQSEVSRTLFTLDGRAALRTRLGGEVDGVPVELELVVLKKDGCIYDLQLITAASQLSRCQADFDSFVQGFATQPRN